VVLRSFFLFVVSAFFSFLFECDEVGCRAEREKDRFDDKDSLDGEERDTVRVRSLVQCRHKSRDLYDPFEPPPPPSTTNSTPIVVDNNESTKGEFDHVKSFCARRVAQAIIIQPNSTNTGEMAKSLAFTILV